LNRGTAVGLKKITRGLDCDCPSSASLPLFFIFGGNDPVWHPHRNYDMGKQLLDDITAEGSREYDQHVITPVQRCWTFHQFPLDVVKHYKTFRNHTYNFSKQAGLTQVDYPLVIKAWTAKHKPWKHTHRIIRVRSAPSSAPSSAPEPVPWAAPDFDDLFDDHCATAVV
jgi:hypothetical protein